MKPNPLKLARLRAGVTLVSAAKSVGVARSTLWNWEQGLHPGCGGRPLAGGKTRDDAMARLRKLYLDHRSKVG